MLSPSVYPPMTIIILLLTATAAAEDLAGDSEAKIIHELVQLS